MWDIGARERDFGYEAACFALDNGEERRGEERRLGGFSCRGVFLGGAL